MYQWLFSILISVFVITILGVILPEGKMRNHIKRTFSLLLMVVIIEPIFSFNFRDFNINDIFSGETIEIQSNYIDFVNKSELESIENNCNILLESVGVKNANIRLITNTNYEKIEIIKVYINLENSVINSEKEHIFIIEEIKLILSNYLKISKEMVVVNEQ